MRKFMMRKSLFIAAALSAAFLAGGAQAQTAGTYSGMTADGGNISLVITGTAPNFTITSMNVGFTANCKHPVGSTTEGWGFFLGIPVVPAETDFHSGNHYYDITGFAKFPNNHSIKGGITSVTAVFVPGSVPPNAAHFCASPNQAFHLDLQPAAKVVPAEPGTAVALPQPDVK
jgi:hypothetical protein